MKKIADFFSNVGDALSPSKGSFSGAMDVIVVQWADGSLYSTPFHVKFSRFKSVQCQQPIVNIIVNNQETDITMTLTNTGKAVFSHITTETLKPDYDISLSTPDLKSFHLNTGINIIHYSLQAKKQILLSAKIYLWDFRSKIIVTDIDGTVTKSDILGHLFYMIGKDWKKDKIVELLQKMRRKGYQIVYLSARSVDQMDYTRGYLAWVTSQGDFLPDGPVILSPNGIYTSLAREITSTSYIFKINALMQILNLFPHYFFPFYAGIGNKTGDATAYLQIGMDKDKVFIIRDSEKKEELFMAIQHFDEIIEDINDRFPCIDDYIFI